MGEADVQLVQSWAEQVALAEDPLDFWYENVWAEDVDHRAAEGSKIVPGREYLTMDDALRAAGLSE